MGTQATPPAPDVSKTDAVPGNAITSSSAATPARSFWIDLAISFAAGLLYALVLMGPGALNPRNVNWVTVDPAYHYVGWEMLRQDPHVHWPLTYTDRLGYPKGESVALTDLNPLLAVTLRPFSSLLGEPFQYFGLEVIVACALQFFFAFRLFRLVLGTNVLGIALCSVFFLLAPPLNYRLMGHYSLSNQWLLLAALYIFFRLQIPIREEDAWVGHPTKSVATGHAPAEPVSLVRQFVISGAVLAAVAVGINPYIAFQVLLILLAGVVSLLWQKRVKLLPAAGIAVLFCAGGFVVAYALGLVIEGGRGYTTGGYRVFSLNLLSPIDPRGWSSIVLHRLSTATPGQYEGYAYLGLGVLALMFLVLGAVVMSGHKMPSLDRRWAIPLLVSCLVLTLLALSTRVTLGSRTILDLDPGEKLSPYLASLRASGRLFWAPYYLILFAVLAAPFVFFRRTWANALVAFALLVQIADTASLRHWVHTTIAEAHPSPLQSPLWATLGATYQNLIVLPAWQCGGGAAPLGPESYRIFGFLAAQQKMRTNSYQSARFTEQARDWHCHQAIVALSQLPLSPDSVYVVTPELADRIAAGPTGPGHCHDVDRVVICSVKTDFGLSPVLFAADERLERAIANPGFEDGEPAPWSPVWEVNANVVTGHVHSGTHSLAENGIGSVYQDVTSLEPGATYAVSAWVSASPNAAAQAQITIYDPTENVAVSSPFQTPDTAWQKVSQSFTAGKEGTARIHLLRDSGAGTVYWDDVRVYREK